MLLNIEDVNSLSTGRFVAIFGNVIELCPNAASEVSGKIPFADVEDLCSAFFSYLDGLRVEQKINILKLHPDLAGRLAAQGKLTQESNNEQRSAGLDRLTAEQKEIIQMNNERYKAKFGFPFIICARENKIQSIISGLHSRYNNLKDQEVLTGINEVKKICKLRILDIVK